MTLVFPNLSRSFDTTRGCVRFSAMTARLKCHSSSRQTPFAPSTISRLRAHKNSCQPLIATGNESARRPFRLTVEGVKVHIL